MLLALVNFGAALFLGTFVTNEACWMYPRNDLVTALQRVALLHDLFVFIKCLLAFILCLLSILVIALDYIFILRIIGSGYIFYF